jgi:type II secretory pathway pseudopilin PulG
MKRGEGGFTVIEVIISLAVSVILLGVVANPQPRRQQRELYAASLQLQSDIRLAQQNALLQGKTYSMAFYSNYYDMGVSLASPTERRSYGDGVVINTHKRSLDEITFTKRGTPNGMGGTVSLMCGAYTQDITILPGTGRVTVKTIKG